MSVGFDPWEAWLGISPAEQPPSLYRLLNLPVGTSDPQAIDDAARRQVLHLQGLALPSPLDEAAKKIISQIVAARNCLRDPAQRQAYDTQLGVPAAPPKPLPSRRLPDALVTAPKPPGPQSPTTVGSPPSMPPVNAPKPQPATATNVPKRRPQPTVIGRILAVALPTAITVGLVLMFPKWFGKKSPAPEEETNSAQTAKLEPVKPSEPAPPKPVTPVKPTPAAPPKVQQPEITTPREPVEPTPPGPLPVEPTPKPVQPVPPDPPPKPAKQAVPSEAQIAAAQKLLDEVSGPELAAAKKPAEKQVLAEKLLRDGRSLKGQGPDEYVVLNQARSLAIEIGNPELVQRVIDAIAADFAIDVSADRLTAFTSIAPKVTQEAQQRPLAELTYLAANDAAQADDYEKAVAFARLSYTAAQATSDAKLKAAVLARGKELVLLQTGYQAFQKAQAQLRATPDDPAANGAVGRWLYFSKQNYSGGAAYLAKSDDADVAKLAKQESAGSLDANAQLVLADGWWDLAQQREQHADRTTYLQRSKYWYEQALAEATGLAKVKVAKRLEELPKLLPEPLVVKITPGTPGGDTPAGTGTTPAGGTAVALTREKAQQLLRGPYEVASRDVKSGSRRNDVWSFDGSSITAYDDNNTLQTVATWDFYSANGKLRWRQDSRVVFTLYSVNGEEFNGSGIADNGDLIFQVTGKRLKKAGQVHMTATTPQGEETTNWTLYSDGSINIPGNRAQRWALLGTNKFNYQMPGIRGQFLIQADKKSFASKLPNGQSVKGTVEFSN